MYDVDFLLWLHKQLVETDWFQDQEAPSKLRAIALATDPDQETQSELEYEAKFEQLRTQRIRLQEERRKAKEEKQKVEARIAATKPLHGDMEKT